MPDGTWLLMAVPGSIRAIPTYIPDSQGKKPKVKPKKPKKFA
jgi:hypothetical protein